jgi:hypothetical protein
VAATAWHTSRRSGAAWAVTSLESSDGAWNAIGLCAVERKSCEDFQSTILEFAETKHRGAGECRFASELANLQTVNRSNGAAMLVVEATGGTIISTMRQRGVRVPQTLASTLFGALVAVIQDYQVPVMFWDSRRLAEQFTFRFLERFWKHHGPKRVKGRKADGNDDGPTLFN